MTTDYGIEALTFIPPEMNPWALELKTAEPSEFGEYVLIGCEQASIETHHQVEVVDEDGKPLRGVWVIFGFSSGRPINMPTRINHWEDAPTNLRGNPQRTNAMGYAQHTFGEGGEDIFIWDRNREGDLLYPSPIVRNCTWQRTPVANFEHTGVQIRFQLRRAGVIPMVERWRNIEERLAAVEVLTGSGGSMLEAHVAQIEARLERLEGGG